MGHLKGHMTNPISWKTTKNFVNMEERRMKGTWVRSSSTPNRTERLKAHMEFESSDLKRMLDEGWEIKGMKPKRPRIKKPVFKLFGTLECKFEIPIEVLIKAGFAE